GGRGEEPTVEAAEEVEDEVRAGMQPRQPLRRSDRMIPVPTPGSERSGQRVAVLVDLAALLEQARAQGGELAFGKLVQHLARRRHLIRAIAYASPELLVEIGSALRGSDLDVHAIATPSDLPVALAVDAMSLASRVDCVVLAPAVDHLAPLAAALRAHGVRIETAGFTETSGMADDLATARHPLGAESLFVP
ncbi:MAG: NYN domain-containing protein, partial [Planctomycetota bacterium]|nr:NYN domain-containing protein [Planctomycetota bacterium]